MAHSKQVHLTQPEKKALRAFRTAKKKAGMPPELAEVAAELGQTSQGVQYALDNLVAKGRLIKVGRYRGYREPARKPSRRRAAA